MHAALLLAALALAVDGAEIDAGTGQVYQHKELKTGDLDANLRLLNLWDPKTEVTQRFYSAAYRVLAADQHASFADLADADAFQTLCPGDGPILLGGPMLGVIGPESVCVWVRTSRPAAVGVAVTIDGERTVFGPVRTSRESDLAAVVPVTGLAPRTTYPYEVLIAEPSIWDPAASGVEIPGGAVIVTTGHRDQPGTTRVAFGTCFHAWGLGNARQAHQILARRPDALLLGGDIAVQDRDNHLGLHRADYLLREMHPGWRDLVAAVPVYATWDDHDYFNNDKAGIPQGFTAEDRQGVRDVFCHAWNNPAYGFGEEQDGIFFRTRVGACDIIMLDHRYFRTGEKGSFLGGAQMRWFKDQLLACRGPFVILSCGTMWSDYVSSGKDSWGRWDPDGREEIFQFIEANHIGGVLLISGDRHGARVFRIPRPAGHTFYEFEPGSLGGRIGPSPTSEKWEDVQLFGISGQYAFGEFTFDTTPADPTVDFRLVHEDGSVLYQIQLTRSQLTPQ